LFKVHYEFAPIYYNYVDVDALAGHTFDVIVLFSAVMPRQIDSAGFLFIKKINYECN